MGFGERSAAALSSADEAYHVDKIDVRDACPRKGRRFYVYAPYVGVKDAPPGVAVKIRFGRSSADLIDVRPGESYPVKGAKSVWVEWTQQLDAEVESGRYQIVLVFSHTHFSLPVTDRVEIVEAPATGGRTFQVKFEDEDFEEETPGEGTGIPRLLSSEFTRCSGLRITANPNNDVNAGVAWSFADDPDAGADLTNFTDGTGNGDVIWPGQVITIAVDSPSRIYINMQNTTDMISVALLNPRR